MKVCIQSLIVVFLYKLIVILSLKYILTYFKTPKLHLQVSNIQVSGDL